MPLPFYLNNPLNAEAMIGTEQVTAMEDSVSYHEQLSGSLNCDDMFRYMYYDTSNVAGSGDSVMHIRMTEAGANYFKMDDEEVVASQPTVGLTESTISDDFQPATAKAIMSQKADMTAEISYGMIMPTDVDVTQLGRGIIPSTKLPADGEHAPADAIFANVPIRAKNGTVATQYSSSETANSLIPEPRQAYASAKVSHPAFVRLYCVEGEVKKCQLAQNATCDYQDTSDLRLPAVTEIVHYDTSHFADATDGGQSAVGTENEHEQALLAALEDIKLGNKNTMNLAPTGASAHCVINFSTLQDTDKPYDNGAVDTSFTPNIQDGGHGWKKSNEADDNNLYTGWMLARLEGGSPKRVIGSLFEFSIPNDIGAGVSKIGYRGYTAKVGADGALQNEFPGTIPGTGSGKFTAVLQRDGSLEAVTESGSGYDIVDMLNDSKGSFTWTHEENKEIKKSYDTMLTTAPDQVVSGLVSRVSVAPTILGYVDTTKNHEQGKAFKKDRRALRELDDNGNAITVTANSSNQLNNDELQCSADMTAFLGRKIQIKTGAGNKDSDYTEFTVIGVNVSIGAAGSNAKTNIRMSTALSVAANTALWVCESSDMTSNELLVDQSDAGEHADAGEHTLSANDTIRIVPLRAKITEVGVVNENENQHVITLDRNPMLLDTDKVYIGGFKAENQFSIISSANVAPEGGDQSEVAGIKLTVQKNDDAGITAHTPRREDGLYLPAHYDARHTISAVTTDAEQKSTVTLAASMETTFSVPNGHQGDNIYMRDLPEDSVVLMETTPDVIVGAGVVPEGEAPRTLMYTVKMTEDASAYLHDAVDGGQPAATRTNHLYIGADVSGLTHVVSSDDAVVANESEYVVGETTYVAMDAAVNAGDLFRIKIKEADGAPANDALTGIALMEAAASVATLSVTGVAADSDLRSRGKPNANGSLGGLDKIENADGTHEHRFTVTELVKNTDATPNGKYYTLKHGQLVSVRPDIAAVAFDDQNPDTKATIPLSADYQIGEEALRNVGWAGDATLSKIVDADLTDKQIKANTDVVIEHYDQVADRAKLTTGKYFEVEDGSRIIAGEADYAVHFNGEINAAQGTTVDEVTQFPFLDLYVNRPVVTALENAPADNGGGAQSSASLKIYGGANASKEDLEAKTATLRPNGYDHSAPHNARQSLATGDRVIIFDGIYNNGNDLKLNSAPYKHVYLRTNGTNDDGDHTIVRLCGIWSSEKNTLGNEFSYVNDESALTDRFRFKLSEEAHPNGLPALFDGADNTWVAEFRPDTIATDSSIAYSGTLRDPTGVDQLRIGKKINLPSTPSDEAMKDGVDALLGDYFVGNFQSDLNLNAQNGPLLPAAAADGTAATFAAGIRHGTKIRLNPGWTDRHEVVLNANLGVTVTSGDQVYQKSPCFTSSIDKLMEIELPGPLSKYGADSKQLMSSNKITVENAKTDEARLKGLIMAQGYITNFEAANANALWLEAGRGYDARFDVPRPFIGGAKSDLSVAPTAEQARAEGLGNVLGVTLLTNGYGYEDRPTVTIQKPVLATEDATHVVSNADDVEENDEYVGTDGNTYIAMGDAANAGDSFQIKLDGSEAALTGSALIAAAEAVAALSVHSRTNDKTATAASLLGMKDDPSMSLKDDAFLDLRPLKQALCWHEQSYSNIEEADAGEAGWEIYANQDTGDDESHPYHTGVMRKTKNATSIAAEYKNANGAGAAGHTLTELIDYNVDGDMPAKKPAHYRRQKGAAFTDSEGRDEANFWRNALNQMATSVGNSTYYTPYGDNYTRINAIDFASSLTQNAGHHRADMKALDVEVKQDESMDYSETKNKEAAKASWNRVIDSLPDILAKPSFVQANMSNIEGISAGATQIAKGSLVPAINGGDVGTIYGLGAVNCGLRVEQSDSTGAALEAMLDRMLAEGRLNDSVGFTSSIDNLGEDSPQLASKILQLRDETPQGGAREQDTLHITMTVTLKSADSESATLINPAANTLLYPTNYIREADRDAVSGDINTSAGAGKFRVRFRITQDNSLPNCTVWSENDFTTV
jgi:hypothetical protein